MGRRLEYEVKTSVRLNMSNPQHVKINDVIQNLDPKIFKSKNQFIIDAIQFYIDNYGKETFVIKKKEKERAEYIRSEDIDDIKEEVIEAATNEATYVSTEGEPAIKQLEAEQNEQVKKKGRKAEPETVTADSAVKKQEEFEAMKKKTRNMLLGLVAVIVAAVAGIAAYKAMH